MDTAFPTKNNQLFGLKPFIFWKKKRNLQNDTYGKCAVKSVFLEAQSSLWAFEFLTFVV